MKPIRLDKLSLLKWSDILDLLAAQPAKGLANLGTKDFKEFLQEHLGGTRLTDFLPLSNSLGMIQQYRSGSAHYQEASSRLEKEEWELEQMRNLVLGIDNKPSVIVQIFKVLGSKK